jgi:hypothetical protein
LKSGFLFACAAVLAAAQCFLVAHAAQPEVRVKAKLTAFDGQVMTLEPLKDQVGAKAGEAITVSVLPETRYVGSDKTSFAALKRGDYAGAAVSEGRGGVLRAQDVYLYAEALRGTGEGRFPEAGRLIINGAVSAAQPAVDDKHNGTLTLHYRGALLNGLGRGRTLCEGRASPPAYASALACEGDATIEVPPGAPVSTLSVGDKSLLVPGSLVTVALTKSADDKNVTPGVIVEKTVTVEKPQSAP